MVATKRLLRAVFRPILRRQVLRQLDQIRAIEIPTATKISAAIEDVVQSAFSVDEMEWVRRIENLRDKLSQASTPIAMTDFGAGDATDQRTEEQMLAGVVKTKTVSEICRFSKPYVWCLLLHKLVRKLQPSTAMEMGTCMGISAAYQAAAQKLNGSGKLLTMEGAPALAELSQENLRSLGLDNATVVCGRFFDTLAPTLQANAPIDYAFIDGHHDEQATLAYFEQFHPYLVDGAVLVFDDIAWSPGMRRAWKKLVGDPRVAVSIDLHTVGICVCEQEPCHQKHQFIIRMPD